MTPEQEELLEAARDSIRAAQLLVENGFPGYAASRAYYAMFYTAEAVLDTKGLSFSKHSAVIAAFGKEFAKPGIIPTEFHYYLREALDVRQSGDYGPRSLVTAPEALEQIERAETFLELVEDFME